MKTVRHFILGAPKSLQMVTPWKKSYDQPRQHNKKQKHYFANNGPSSQSYGFSSSHVWMWQLVYKESWAPKNWCFWTVVLEKTLESPLDCKEIQPVHPKELEKGMTEDEMTGWHHQLGDMRLSKLRELVMNRRPGVLQSMGSQSVGHEWVTELTWTALPNIFNRSVLLDSLWDHLL